MKKPFVYFSFWLAFAFLLAACSDPKPTPFPVTEAPTTIVEPTQVKTTSSPLEEVPTQSIPTKIPPTITPLPLPTATPVPPTPTALPNRIPDPHLLNRTWQWYALTSPVLDVTIQQPEKYLIQFYEDGSIQLQADCNLLQASYTLADANISINLTPANAAILLAECPDGALYELYLLALDTTNSFTLLEDNLVLFAGQNGTVMRFNEADSEIPESGSTEAAQPSQPTPTTNEATGAVNAPDGINMREGPGIVYPTLGIIPDGTTLTILGRSEDREWWVIENPEQPNENAWVSRSFVEAVNTNGLPTFPTPEVEPTLLDFPWQWQSLTTSGETTTVGEPSLYTIQFFGDGTAVFRADCNTATTTYTTDDNAININMAAITFVACPGDSLDALYLNNLTNVTTFFFETGDLFLELPAGGGAMRFAPDRPPIPETPEAPEETPIPSPEAEGDLFQVVSFGLAGAEQDILARSEITVIITETEVKGNAGCNNYSGMLNRTDESFTISNLSVTERACAEPAGVMAQEQAFLTALQNTGAFSWQERLSDDGGRIVTVGQFFYVTGGNGIINLITP